MKSESIRTIGRIGYIRLIDDWSGDYHKPERGDYVSLDDGEWQHLFWYIYWRVS